MHRVRESIGDAFLFVLQVEVGLRLTSLGSRLRSSWQQTRGTSLQIVHDLLVCAGSVIRIYSADKLVQRGTFDSHRCSPRKVAAHCYS